MIRPFTIFGKLNQIRFSDRQWRELETASFRAEGQPCPSCTARGCLVPFASYLRYLVGLERGAIVTSLLLIPRFRCTSCGHTHAILSSCLVPYQSYSLRFILQVLRDYFLHLRTVGQLCETYGIAPSTLYSWKTRFLSQKSLWLGILDNLVSMAADFLEELRTDTLCGFLVRFGCSFLVRMPCRFPELPFLPPGRERTST